MTHEWPPTFHHGSDSIFIRQVEMLRWPWEFGRPVKGACLKRGDQPISPSALEVLAEKIKQGRKALKVQAGDWNLHVSAAGFTMVHDVSRCFTMFHDVSRCFTMFHDVSRCFARVLLSRQSFQKHSGVYTCLLIPYHSHRLQPLNWNCHHRLDSDAKWVAKDFCIPNVGDLKSHGHQVTPHFVLLSKDFYMKAGTR